MIEIPHLTELEWDLLSTLVFNRDEWRCMAGVLDPKAHPKCYDKWGYPFSVNVDVRNPRRTRQYLTLDHVHLHAGGTKGKKAPNLAHHLISVCWGAHEGRGPLHGYQWSTSQRGREIAREYLLNKHPEAASDQVSA